jgi:hypothetical protein
MKKILWTVARALGAAIAGALGYAATVDVETWSEIFTNLQAIGSALGVIAVAGGGIYNKVQQARALKQTAITSAAYMVPMVESASGTTDMVATKAIGRARSAG